MKQSRATSFIKSLVSTAVGFAVAFIANMIILPWFGLDISHGANFVLTCIYTAISIARGYALERVYEAMGWRTRMSAFALAVLAERQRQMTHEGYDAYHDDDHSPGELAKAAATYADFAFDTDATRLSELNYQARLISWPWDFSAFKPTGIRRDLVKAGALILAEGERVDRNRKVKRNPPPASPSEPVVVPANGPRPPGLYTAAGARVRAIDPVTGEAS